MVPTPPVAFFGADVSPGELLLLFAVVLVFFGPKQLPRVARSLGKALEQLKSASQEFRDQVMSIDDKPDSVPSPPSRNHPSGPEPDETRADDTSVTPSGEPAQTPAGNAGNADTPPSEGPIADARATDKDKTHDLAG